MAEQISTDKYVLIISLKWPLSLDFKEKVLGQW